MATILIYAVAGLFAAVGAIALLEMAREFFMDHPRQLWPDGQDEEPPVKHVPHPLPFAKRRIPLTDLERRRVAERIIGIKR